MYCTVICHTRITDLLTGPERITRRLRALYLSYKGRTKSLSPLATGRPKMPSRCNKAFCTATFSSNSCSLLSSAKFSDLPASNRFSDKCCIKNNKERWQANTKCITKCYTALFELHVIHEFPSINDSVDIWNILIKMQHPVTCSLPQLRSLTVIMSLRQFSNPVKASGYCMYHQV